jgi:hypothetical protein
VTEAITFSMYHRWRYIKNLKSTSAAADEYDLVETHVVSSIFCPFENVTQDPSDETTCNGAVFRERWITALVVGVLVMGVNSCAGGVIAEGAMLKDKWEESLWF